MKLEPLKQWVCDVCGRIIESPEEGYVIWNENDDGMIDKIRIVHKNALKNGKQEGCDKDLKNYPRSSSLVSFLGDEGKVLFLSLVDPGPNFIKEYKKSISDIRLFLEVFRRLQLPYYEEARLYWNKARDAGFFADVNEVSLYLPKTLKYIVDNYSGGKDE